MKNKFFKLLSGDFLWQTLPMWLAWIFLVAVTILYALVSVYFTTQNGDNIEHIHSSFLIASGEVPYRDFFQHHHPLMWYLFAPLVWWFRYDTTISEVVCFVSFLVFLKSLTYVYRIIAEFLADRFWGLIGAAAVAVPASKFYTIDFRPDNFMVFCLMGGIYYYFCYLSYQKRRQLIYAFIWFFAGFMFAQKALFPLCIIGLSTLFFLYKGEIKGKDFAWALIFPIAGTLLFLLYLYHYDMVRLYFLCNYIFNIELAQSFEFTKIAEMPFYMIILAFLGWIGSGYALFFGNRYLRVLAILFVSEFFQRQFYFSPYSYYYWLLLHLGVFCTVPLFYAIAKRFRALGLISVLGLYVPLCFVGYTVWYYREIVNKPYLPDYVTRHITPCDYVFNGDGIMYNIFAKDPSYYWQLIGQLDVIGEKVGIHPKPDINALILKFKPKFVYGRNYFNKFAEEALHKEIVHYVDTDILNKYYKKTKFSGVYQLRYEYVSRDCQWDEEQRSWNYRYPVDVN